MDLRDPRRKMTRLARVLWMTTLLACCCTSTALAAASSSTHSAAQVKLAGKWKGQYSGAFSGHFTLHWTQTGRKLSGAIKLSNPKGKYGIDGSIRHGGKVKFGALGVGASYKGTVHGKTMSGTWSSPQGGGSWSARKVS